MPSPARIRPWIRVVGALFAMGLGLGLLPASASAHYLRDIGKMERVNRGLRGWVVDHTNNHGCDRRIWSAALCQKRDLYVYLPPDFDPGKRYPLAIWLHGFAQDEHAFLDHVVTRLDAAISCGKLPPLILAAPDGSLSGQACFTSPGSFFINSKAGRFEDYLMQDVWEFLLATYPIRPEREARALVGASMGGGAAFNLGIKYRDRVRIVIGIYPPLNWRWLDCFCRYKGNFDPCCWGWRTDFSRGHEVVARFYGIPVRLKQIMDPLYNRRAPDIVEHVSRENPIEMLAAYELQPGELSMYVAYGGRDQFNLDAQIESFLYVARQRGLDITVAYDPKGKHDPATALEFLPGIVAWLAPQLAPYSPCP